MRTEAQVRARLERLEALLKGPVEVGIRQELTLRIDELRRVLEQWPYRHAFEVFEHSSGEQRPYCGLCGRDEDDELHSDEEGPHARS